MRFITKATIWGIISIALTIFLTWVIDLYLGPCEGCPFSLTQKIIESTVTYIAYAIIPIYIIALIIILIKRKK